MTRSAPSRGWLPVLAAIGLLCVLSADAADCFTNQPLPGIVLHAETGTNPPTRLFVAEIDLGNPQVKVRVVPGGADPDGPGQWQTTLMQPTRIAAREHFDLVVNGDFFLAREIKDAEGTNSRYRADAWAAAEGPAVTDGNVWSTGTNSRPCLVVHKDRRVTIEPLENPSADDWEVVAGNIMLVQNGAIVPHTTTARHPRTIVGLNAAQNKLFVVVVDGRHPGVAIGMSYDEEAALMLRLGCRQALNLDGGGSSVMAIRGASGDYQILNTPSDGHERPVANALGISVR